LLDVELPVNVIVGIVQVIEPLVEALTFCGSGSTITSTVFEDTHIPFVPVTV
jgi:hypothetical protein